MYIALLRLLKPLIIQGFCFYLRLFQCLGEPNPNFFNLINIIDIFNSSNAVTNRENCVRIRF